AEGVIRFWNRAAELVTGIPRAVAVDRQVQELAAEWPAIETSVQAATADERPRPVTLPIELNGRELWLSFVAVRMADGVVYAFRDLTPERQLEESKNEFIATVSHELRTPMTAVLGAANTLLRTDVELEAETRHQLLEMISTQAARLAQVTETVLLAGRLDRDEVKLAQTVVDVESVVRETVAALEPTLPEGTTVQQQLGPAGSASGDADRLQQVLLNLVDNAVKYGGAGATVLVSTARAGDRVQLDAASLELLVRGAAIVGREEDRSRKTLRHQLANLGGCLVIHDGRPGNRHQDDVDVGLAGGADGQPAEVAQLRQRGVGAHLPAEALGVE